MGSREGARGGASCHRSWHSLAGERKKPPRRATESRALRIVYLHAEVRALRPSHEHGSASHARLLYAMLDSAQTDLLGTLALASRAVPKTPFAVSVTDAPSHTLALAHPGLDRALSAYRGDLIALEDASLIRVQERRTASDYDFDLTVAGLRMAEEPVPAAAPAATSGDRKQWGKWLASGDRPFKTSPMSALWRVRDVSSDARDHRALKVLRYPKGRGSASYRRFVREIETLAKGPLSGKHPGIIEVLDHAIPEEGDPRDPYYVMPLANGSLQDAGKMIGGQLEASIRYLIPVVEALGVAHDTGVIHRDIKPANILVFDGRPVLADFGICFLEGEERVTKTEHGTVGTDEFVAPELLGGGKADPTPAADAYSLGKTLFALVSGGEVFPREWIDDARYDLATRFSDARLHHLRGIMARLVREDPTTRPQTMAEVGKLLEDALHNVRDGVPYREEMYAGETSAVARASHLARLISLPTSTARSDGIRHEMNAAMDASEARASTYSATRQPMPTGQVHKPGIAAAAESAEELLGAGLPLVIADERDYFEGWLATALAPLTKRDGMQMSAVRMVLLPAGVLAAHGAGAVAWRRWRLEIFRLIVDRHVSDGTAWLHHEMLGRNSVSLAPWIGAALSASEVLRAQDAPVAADPATPVSMVAGIAVLKWLAATDEQVLVAFANDQQRHDFPIPFAPGLMTFEWVQELLTIGLRGGPDERQFAEKVFEMSVVEFRALCGRLTPHLLFLAEVVARKRGVVPYFSLGVEPKAWERWTGVEMLP